MRNIPTNWISNNFDYSPPQPEARADRPTDSPSGDDTTTTAGGPDFDPGDEYERWEAEQGAITATEDVAEDAPKRVALGNRDVTTGRLVLSQSRTLPTARSYVDEFHDHEDGPTLRHYADTLMAWRNNRYEIIEDGEAKNRLLHWLHGAVHYHQDRIAPFPANDRTVNGALQAIKAYSFLPSSTLMPSWLDSRDDDLPAAEILACRSKLVHLPTLRELRPTPRFFTANAIDFDYSPDAPTPTAWHTFLHQLFDGDEQSLDLLQEWFGYCLTGDTSRQKALTIVGPPRSGKGTMARVLEQLVGKANCCGPTTDSLASPFGLQPLIGKSLAIVSDARFRGAGVSVLIERLLQITGENTITVQRKYKDAVELMLPTRFVFLTNEIPALTDASAAIASRFMLIELSQSFLGKEDHDLTRKLLSELPGILKWAIEGWHRLHERGRFKMPDASTEAAEMMADLSSPVAAFVRDYCRVGPDETVETETLLTAYRAHCLRQGIDRPPAAQSFGRQLRAAVTEAKIHRRRKTDDVPFYEGISLKEPPPTTTR